MEQPSDLEAAVAADGLAMSPYIHVVDCGKEDGNDGQLPVVQATERRVAP
jgi:hypothetical protein